MSKLDADRLYKTWCNGAGSRVEDKVLRTVRRTFPTIGEQQWFTILSAVRDAILDAWEAGWDAAGGDEDAD